MTKQEALFRYLLRLGDNALIQSYRLSEWCSRGPILEEDLAMTNISLDYLGRTRALYQYAAIVEGKERTEDDLAYKRPEIQYYNNLITELPIGNFAFTIARQLLISVFEFLHYTQLSQSKDETIAAITAKTLKEIRYHKVHSRDWCYRLGRGTEVSHTKLQQAFDEAWMYTGELFEMCEEDQILMADGVANNLEALLPAWKEEVSRILADSDIKVPNVDYMQTGSRKGIHSENLGHILSEMQYLPRAYPDAIW